MRYRWIALALPILLVPVAGCNGGSDPPADDEGSAPVRTASFRNLIPRPSAVAYESGEFTLSEQTPLVVSDGADAGGAAELLAEYLAPVLGASPPLVEESEGPAVHFDTADADEDLGPEGYVLQVGPERIVISATGRTGFLWAVQTLRQAVATGVEVTAGGTGTPPGATPGPIALSAVTIRDRPRFEWRGVMLDVARHFYPVDVVKSTIDLAASFKLNRFHIHLTDDQGWRLESPSYPELTDVGAQTAVGGGSGGHYTRDEYRDIVEYAARRGVVVVPEIDMPGHTQAALASIPWLNCDGESPPVRTDILVGLSTLCVDDERVYDFVRDVVGEVARLTPGPYIHIGGDEASQTSDGDYRRFIERTVEIVRDHDKIPIGWEEIAGASLGSDTVAQLWVASPESVGRIAEQRRPVIVSVAQHAYLDMRYDESTPIGQVWAGLLDTEKAYGWDPATQVPALDPEQVMGVEACLWTEFVESAEHIRLLLLPRLPALAEVAWTAQEDRDWDDFSHRVATFGARWERDGVYTRDPGVPWP